MKAGLIADVVVILFAIVMVVLCTKRGFIRSLLRYTSMIASLLAAFFLATPLANFLDAQFALCSVIDTWHLPMLNSSTVLVIACGIAIFVVARLILIVLDKLLNRLRERIAVVNTIDRILGMVFGLLIAIIELASIFMIIDSFGLQGFLQLTPESGSYVAQYLFRLFKAYVFPVFNSVLSAAGDYLPKV